MSLAALSPETPRTGQPAAPALQFWHLDVDAPPWSPAGVVRRLAPASLGTALARWRDQALAPLPVVAAMQPRLLAGRLLGLDLAIQQPVPGRLAWPGDHRFLACDSMTACGQPQALPSGTLLPAWRSAAGELRWLGDAGLADGEELNDWRTSLAGTAQQDSLLALLSLPADDTQRRRLRQALQDELADPPLLRGRALYLDGGADSTAASGRRGHLLWPTADGALLLLESESDRPLWAWRPAATLRQWLRHRLDPAAARPDAVADSWQVWPPADAATPPSRRYAYGLADGVLLALDLSQPLHPRRLFRSPLPATLRAGSLGVFSVPLVDGPHPLLMLAGGDAPDDELAGMLWLLDGVSGDVLWRAGNREEAGVSLVDARLRSAWRAPWRTLMAADGSVLAYGVDVAGSVWQLRLRGRQVLSARLAASLGDAQALSSGERFVLAPSLTWLRDGGMVARPALALASESGAGGEAGSLFAFIDTESADGHVLSRTDLAVWPVADARPPAHPSGWRRPWRFPGERAGSPPLWIARQVVVASEWPEAGQGCAPALWSSRVQRLPWRGDVAGAAGEAEVRETGAGAQPQGGPVLADDGTLRWPGRPEAVLSLPRQAAERIRTGLRPWSGQP